MKDQPQNRQYGLTVRVLFLVLLIAPVNCYLLIQMELVRYTFPTWVVPLSECYFHSGRGSRRKQTHPSRGAEPGISSR